MMRERAGFLALPLLRILLALGTVSLALAASVGPSSATAEPVDAVSAITLVEQRVIEIAGSQLHRAVARRREDRAPADPLGRNQPSSVSMMSRHSPSAPAPMSAASMRASGRTAWSGRPDSAWLAFAELWPQFIVDGDLWLMDASTGALSNLLDDGYSGALGLTSEGDSGWEDTITLPSYPTFTPDSAAVTFSRGLFEDGEPGSVNVVTVPITGGAAVQLGDLERDTPGFDYLRKHWTADGSALYVSVDYQASGLGPDSGIWVFGADEGEDRLLLGISGPDEWPPSIVAVSPRGEHLSSCTRHIATVLPTPSSMA